MNKRRVLVTLFLLYCIGIGLGLTIKIDLTFLIMAILSLITISTIRYLNSRKIFCHIYLILLCTGLLLSSYKVSSFEQIADELDGKNIRLYGQISSDIRHEGNMSIFTMYLSKLEAEGREYSCRCKIKIVDYRNDDEYIVPFNTATLNGKFKKAVMYNNTLSPDYNMFLYKEGICGTVVASFIQGLSSESSGDRCIQQLAYRFKRKVESILDLYTDDNSLKLFKGLLFGDTSGISKDEYISFQESGIIHIFAVSGYNIWLILYVLNKCFFFLNSMKHLKTFIILSLLGMYVVVSGLTSSVIRAYVMASSIILGRLMKREADPLTSLSLAGFLILSFNPLCILDVGFQLSFMSAASIILLMPILMRSKIPVNPKVKEPVLLALSVQTGIAPIIVYYFNSIPILSPVSNLLIVPLASLITLLGIALCIFHYIFSGLALVLGQVAIFVTNIVFCITDIISSLPYCTLNIISPGVFEIVLYYFTIAAAFKLIKVREAYRRRVFYGIIAVFLCYPISHIFPRELSISFIDVGQGDCILITTPDRKNVLIDGGGIPENLYSGIDIGENVLKPYLYRRGINKIDLIVSTHAHEDHLNGLIPVMAEFSFDRFVKGVDTSTSCYGKLEEKILIKENFIADVSRGDLILVGKHVKMYVLNPDGLEDDENDSSIVLKMVYRDFSALFTGDIGLRVEKKLAEHDIEADVLKVPHHGSSTSLGEDFLECVNPKVAVICVGDNNYGHPSPETIEKIKERGIELYRTDENGEIIITTRGRGFRVKTVM